MNERELVEAAVSYLTSAACVDVALLTDQKVALFLCFLTFNFFVSTSGRSALKHPVIDRNE